MDNSFRRQEADAQQRSGFLAILQVLHGILKRLTGLIHLTEAEQKDAGIYLGDQRYK